MHTKKIGTLGEALEALVGRPNYSDDLLDRGYRMKFKGGWNIDVGLKVKSILDRHSDYVIKFDYSYKQKTGKGAGFTYGIIHLLTNPRVIPYKAA